MQKTIALLAIIALVAMPMVMAYDFNQQPSDTDKATFDQILQPVMKIYNLVKYVASAIAAIALFFAGVTYMMSGTSVVIKNNLDRDVLVNVTYHVYSKWFGIDKISSLKISVKSNSEETANLYDNAGCNAGMPCSVSMESFDYS